MRESNNLCSVTSVSLSFPPPANRRGAEERREREREREEEEEGKGEGDRMSSLPTCGCCAKAQLLHTLAIIH
jgi:hypothetical protein